VQEAAQLVHAFLKPAVARAARGVPVKRVHDWDTVKGFSPAVVAHMAKTILQRFVARSGPMNRVGKISVPVNWVEPPALRGGNHWSVKTAARTPGRWQRALGWPVGLTAEVTAQGGHAPHARGVTPRPGTAWPQKPTPCATRPALCRR
jgi:bifunctional non-homologous end joining protein LigD